MLKDIESGHLLLENVVNIFLLILLLVSLHNLLDFYNLFCLCCIVMSRRSLSCLVGRFLYIYICIFVWKLNQAVLELYF